MTTAPGPVTTTRAERGLPGGVGDSPARPDGRQKVTGEFAYSSDLWLDGMLWGATVRSPHPRARLIRLDISGALTVPGVAAVLTHEDVPGARTYGLEHKDQPVLAWDQVRYQGEPVALVAADHPETARRAAARIGADYEVLPPVTGARAALDPDAPALHEGGNLVRHVRIRKGHPDTPADVVVHGEYQVGMQDQAFLGPESGLAVPAADGGVDLFVATQWLHVDRDQIAASLGLPGDKVRITLSGVGGAFGAREDLSMQIHACLLALRTGKPVKMVYSREESFFGHVHRHPASLRYEHGSTADGRLVYVKADIVLDGGAYASSSPAVAANAATLGVGPYEVPHVAMDCYAVYTNNPPCGAMRGFGAVQACFAYETQMDKLAAALGMDPVELRIRNAMREGSVMPTGQVVDSAAPVAEILKLVASRPLPPASGGSGAVDLRTMPGGVSNTTHGEGVVRGVGYAVGIKNVGFSEGFDDYSTARVRLELAGGEPVAQVHTAAAEVGQGLVTVLTQIARTELGVQRVVILPADTSIGSAGSTSASRQTYVTGGAVRAACRAVRAQLDRRAQERFAGQAPGLAGQARPGRAARRAGRADGDLAAPAHPSAGPGDRPGPGPPAVRVRRPPGGGRRGHRARPGEGGGDRHRAGCGQGAEPAGRRGPDPGRHRPGPRPGRDGGDPGDRRPGAQPVLHRLPDSHHPGHAPDPAGRARARRPQRPVRPAGSGRAAGDLLDPRGGSGHPRRHRPGADPCPGPPRAHHRDVMGCRS